MLLTFLSRVLTALPLPVALAIGRFFGRIWYYVIPIRKRTAKQNIQRAFGSERSPAEQQKILKACFENICMYGVDSLRLPALTVDWINENIEIAGREHFEAARAKGKGVIFIAGHFGSWDLCACMHAMLYPPVHVIFKDIKWPAAQKFWRAVRERTGIVPMPPRQAKNLIREALQHGGSVAFPIDQHMAKHRAIVCTMFNQLAATSPAPVRFAYETGAAIIPAVMFRTNKNGQHKFRYEQELLLESPYASKEENIRHNTQRINHIYERWLREKPDQWLWHHKRWKVHDDPEGWEIPHQLKALTPR
jgi:Kdo2-lipid IVA lauroyltransferase/acyltransferase